MSIKTNIAYTIVSKNYLCFAEVLKQSFEAFNPEIIFFICVIDSDCSGENILTSSVLDQTIFNEMFEKYEMFALVCALKPYFASYLLETYTANGIIYLDADILVFNKFDYLETILNNKEELNKSILLTAHINNKIGTENLVENLNYLTYGVYNAGFFAVKNNGKGIEFLNWWKQLLKNYCKDDIKFGLFYDQAWLNLVPNYFYEYYFLIQHPGYNVAYWNIEEREISKFQDEYYCKSDKLIFYHFARFNYLDDLPTKNIHLKNPLMLDIFNNYKMKLRKFGINHIQLNNVKQNKNRFFKRLIKFITNE